MAVTGIAFASDVATVVRVSENVSRFLVHNLVLDETDGRFQIIVAAFNNRLHTMAVDARGFNGSSLIDALRPIALRCHRLETPLQNLQLHVSDFAEYGSLLNYVMVNI